MQLQADPTSLDGFPLYWVKEPKLTKPKTLDELNSADREICQVLTSLGVVFNTAELIKHEYNPAELTKYIGMRVSPSLLTSIFYSLFVLLPLAYLSNYSYCFHNMLVP